MFESKSQGHVKGEGKTSEEVIETILGMYKIMFGLLDINHEHVPPKNCGRYRQMLRYRGEES